MKTLLLLLTLVVSPAFSAIVTSLNADKSCTIYRVTSEKSPATTEEVEYDSRELYGFSLINLKVNFIKQTATVDIEKKVVLGFDRNLNSHPVMIQASNPQFEFLTNQLNRTLHLFEKICLTDSNELLWATFFPESSQP